GGFAPRVSAAPVVFSGGGDAPLVTATTDADASVATKWTGPLPVPTVSGNTATYHDVSPGVNLILTAGITGYEESIVLTRRPSTLPTFRLPLAAKGLSVAQDAHGALKFSAAKGRATL